MARPSLTRRWTDEETAKMKRMLFDGKSARQICLRLKRTPNSVIRMLSEQGLPTPQRLKAILTQERIGEAH